MCVATPWAAFLIKVFYFDLCQIVRVPLVPAALGHPPTRPERLRLAALMPRSQPSTTVLTHPSPANVVTPGTHPCRRWTHLVLAPTLRM